MPIFSGFDVFQRQKEGFEFEELKNFLSII